MKRSKFTDCRFWPSPRKASRTDKWPICPARGNDVTAPVQGPLNTLKISAESGLQTFDTEERKIGLSFVHASIAHAIYVGVALMWLVPDRRIESHVSGNG